MKYLIVFILSTLYHFNLTGQTKIYGFDQLKEDDISLVTQASHDTWIDWSIKDDFIYFISPESGSNNLYRIKVDSIELIEIRDGFYAASYLVDASIERPIEQITFEADRIIDSPVVAPEANKVVYQSYSCDRSYNCTDFNLTLYDLEKKDRKVLVEDQVSHFAFIDSNTLLFVLGENNKVIKQLDLESGEVTKYKALDLEMTTLQVSAGKIIINTSEGVYTIDPENMSMQKIYSGKVVANRLTLYGSMLIATLPGPASSLIDLTDNTEVRLFNAYDYEPTASKKGKYVAAISEAAAGIVVKQIPQ